MSDVLSAHAAAARLGVSDRTVRRWIASGRLKADKAAGEFQIALEDLDTLTGHGAAAAAASGQDPDNAAASDTEGSRLDAAPAAALSAELVALVALIERQQAQLLERTEAAAMWQARAQVLDERVRALEAPKEQPVRPVEPSFSRLNAWRLMLAIRALAALALVLLAVGVWAR
jgi:excisionase family DNA binding protein